MAVHYRTNLTIQRKYDLLGLSRRHILFDFWPGSRYAIRTYHSPLVKPTSPRKSLDEPVGDASELLPTSPATRSGNLQRITIHVFHGAGSLDRIRAPTARRGCVLLFVPALPQKKGCLPVISFVLVLVLVHELVLVLVLVLEDSRLAMSTPLDYDYEHEHEYEYEHEHEHEHEGDIG